MSDKIYFRRGNLADLPTLAAGEPGFAMDTKKLYIGTGSSNQGIVSSAPATQTWIEPTLLNAWVNFDGGYAPAGYYKDDLNIVRVRGIIKNGATAGGTVLFILPFGYRPSTSLAIPSNSSSGSLTIEVLPSGNVRVGSTAAGLDYLSIELTFRAEG